MEVLSEWDGLIDVFCDVSVVVNVVVCVVEVNVVVVVDIDFRVFDVVVRDVVVRDFYEMVVRREDVENFFLCE